MENRDMFYIEELYSELYEIFYSEESNASTSVGRVLLAIVKTNSFLLDLGSKELENFVSICKGD